MHHGVLRPLGDHFVLRCLATAWLGLLTTLWLGCGSKSPPDGATSRTVPGQPPQQQQAPFSGPAGQLAGEEVSPGKAVSGGAEAVPSAPGSKITPQTVLQSMVAAYKQARSYADGGQIALQGQIGEQKLDSKSEFLVAMVRPNKILLRSHQGILVSDGKQLSAYIKELPNQVMQREAPAALTMGSLCVDAILTNALTDAPPQTSALFPTPLILLLAKDPLKTLLYRVEKLELLPSEKLGDSLCYRVQATRFDGNTVYWVDQGNYVLRRVEYPTEALKQAIAGGPVHALSLVADHVAAQLDMDVDPKAFQFEVPPGARVGKSFSNPDLERVGKPVADFEFVDLQGQSITPKSLAGKIAVVDFWATFCMPCRELLPEIQEIFQQYKGHDKVVFLAVSIDDSSVANKKLQETFNQWNVDLPIARDSTNSRQQLGIVAVPTSMILGPDGTVHHFQTGGQPGTASMLAAKIRSLLNGEDVAAVTLKQYEQFSKQYMKLVEQWNELDLFVAPPGAQLASPVAPPSEPATLKRTRLWSCPLQVPGNILVFRDGAEQSRILVLEAGNKVVELGPDGRLVARTPLKLPPQTVLAALRTGTTPEGRRVFVGFNATLPQLYVLDEKLELSLTFPKDEDMPRSEVADVELASLRPGGPLAILVGYWGLAGVQAVSLDGRRLWANKSLIEVSRIAVLEPDSQGGRRLLCTNIDRGTLVLLDADGQRLGEIEVPNRKIAWILGADLTNDNIPELCALAPEPDGNVVAVGLTPEGKELWSHPLPRGAHQTAVDRAVAGNVLGSGPAQWIFPGPDGSLHILTHDGKLLDHFTYGDRLTGLAITTIKGKPVLLVATTQAVEAWQIEPAAGR